jgi:LPPG:FO 2-phospho-L-lactate transferase
MDALKRYEAARPAGSTAGGTWFNLGDQDLATHLYRTQRRAEGAPLSTVTAEIAAAWGLGVRLLPMTDQPVRTRVALAEGGEVGFQEYFVGRAHDVAISGVRFDGVDAAVAGPGVLDAIDGADVVVIAPSNPIVSIGPILAVPGVRHALVRRRHQVVAVSPIVGGRALKGPADRMLRELGMAADAVGVARSYREVAIGLVVDAVDADLAAAVEAEGVRCVVTDTVMATPAIAAALARTTIGAVAHR